ncbi:hypothetical protein [Azospirillum doebereinerae]
MGSLAAWLAEPQQPVCQAKPGGHNGGKLTVRSRVDALDNHGSHAFCTQLGLLAPVFEAARPNTHEKRW